MSHRLQVFVQWDDSGQDVPMDIKRMSDLQLAALIAAGLAVLMGLGWAWYGIFGGNPGTSATSAEASSQGAKAACHEFTERRLKAPSSAEFSGEQASEGIGGIWTVTGSVDSQNSFGAMIRITYRCSAEFTTGGDWMPRDIQLSAN